MTKFTAHELLIHQGSSWQYIDNY